ncbi:MAG: SDR family NAD(P)-dependent oxidoreductase, partial [Spirochaetes bacterium]|nr:SDR family NAD(P)-dependent oxidoreductase [Spirochaetota bacterium]
MKIKKIVITGGAGFLGQHLIERLNNSKKRDFSIIVIDKKKNPCPYINIHKYKNVIIHYDVDITDPVSIKDYFCEADIVYHLAGLVSFYRKDRKKLFKINVTGTENVLRACLDCKVKKVIHISSVAGIGYLDKEDIPADESLKFNWKAVPK